MDKEVEKAAETPTGDTPPTPKGRAALLLAFKKHHNREDEDEVDDDSLFDFAHSGLGERDELKGKYTQLNGANDKLAAAIGQDPRFATVIAMIGAGEKPLYAFGKVFGKVLDQLDDEGLENYKSGQDSYSNSYNQLQQNFEAYKANLKQWGEANGHDEATIQQVNDVILDLSEAFTNWDITPEIIEAAYKITDYDADKAALTEAEALKIKNETIDNLKGAGKKPIPQPDLLGSKQQVDPKRAPRFDDDSEYKPYSKKLRPI